MDRNSIYGLVIIFLILIGYSFWMTPSKEELAATRKKQDSIALVEKINNEAVKTAAAAAAATQTGAQPTSEIKRQDSVTATVNKDKFGAFALSSKYKEENVILESDLVKMTISTHGGSIKSVELKQFKTFDQQALVLFETDTALMSFSFFSNNRVLNTRDLHFEALDNEGKPLTSKSVRVTGKDSVRIRMRLFPNAGDSTYDRSKFIEYAYTLKGNDYMTGFAIAVNGMQQILNSNTDYITLDWNANLRQQEKSLQNERNVSTIYYKYFQNEVNFITETKDEEKELKTRVKWVSFKQQFFASVLIAKESFNNAMIATSKERVGDRYLKTMKASMTLPLNFNQSNSEFAMSIYFGPNKYKVYRKYDLDLERQIPLGWSFFLLAWINKFAVIPTFDFLSGFNWNYGIIILVLTILLKIVLFPIAYKTYISSARMRVLKPEIEEITAKFPKKEDSLKKQQATMDLYKRAGINPMAGCIPMLLQLPILIAMFRFFPASIELRQQPFLWATDLSSYDSILNLSFTIPFYGDHVSLFTLLMTISTIIYTKINNDMMGSSTPQMPGMKTMMYLMPIMFLGFLNSYSSGLSYYYLLANVITFVQMWAFRSFVNEDKIHAQIQANKKKPVTKSTWQKRMEEMATKRGYPAKK
ncbi:MAG: membrane protein insertase YidC [Bacteroidota bacterium]